MDNDEARTVTVPNLITGNPVKFSTKMKWVPVLAVVPEPYLQWGHDSPNEQVAQLSSAWEAWHAESGAHAMIEYSSNGWHGHLDVMIASGPHGVNNPNGEHMYDRFFPSRLEAQRGIEEALAVYLTRVANSHVPTTPSE